MDESTIELLKKYLFDITELNLSCRNIRGILDLNGYDKLTILNCPFNKFPLAAKTGASPRSHCSCIKRATKYPMQVESK